MTKKITKYEKPHLIPRNIFDLKKLKRNGLKFWLTAATLDQACELTGFTWYQKLFRKILK